MPMYIRGMPDRPAFPPGGDPERAARIEAMARHLAAEEAGSVDPEACWRRLLDGERTRLRRRAEALLRVAETAVPGRERQAGRTSGPRGGDA